MKKFAMISILFCTGIFAGSFVFAEDQDYEQPQERRDQGMMMDGDGPGGGQRMNMKSGKGMGMKGGMHGPSSMVALLDGSIVVLSGNKLTKYDGDLNVVKEVEIKGGPKPEAKMEKMEAPPAVPEEQPMPPAEAAEAPQPETVQ